MGAADSEELSRSNVSFRIIHFKQKRHISCLLRFNLPPESTQKSADCRWSVLTKKRRQVRDGLQEPLGVHRLVWRKRFEPIIQ